MATHIIATIPHKRQGISCETAHFQKKEYPEHFAMEKKDITIVSCPENVLQCKYAGELLAQQIQANPDNPVEHTAIVLADEFLSR